MQVPEKSEGGAKAIPAAENVPSAEASQEEEQPELSPQPHHHDSNATPNGEIGSII